MVYTLIVTNYGTLDTTSVIVTDALPEGLVYVSGTWTGSVNSGECVLNPEGITPPATATFTPSPTSDGMQLFDSTDEPTPTPTDTDTPTPTDTPTDTPTPILQDIVLCDLGGLPAGQSVTILITVQADAYGTYVNTASLAVVMPADVTPNDNSDSATTIVEPQAPVVDLDPDDNVGVAPNYFATYPENSPPIPAQDADILITRCGQYDAGRRNDPADQPARRLGGDADHRHQRDGDQRGV